MCIIRLKITRVEKKRPDQVKPVPCACVEVIRVCNMEISELIAIAGLYLESR